VGQGAGGVVPGAAGADGPVGGQAGGAGAEAGIGSVGTFRRGRGGRAEPWPVDDHVTTLGHAGKGARRKRTRVRSDKAAGLPYPTGPFSRPARPPQGGGSR